MTTLATASVTATAAPAAFFARWADMATWPEWNTDTDWVRLDGPFVKGATGVLKPKGGPKVKFVVSKLTDTDFVDVSLLLGAKLTFAHHIAAVAAGSQVEVEVSLTGPLAPVWNLILGKGLKASLQRDLDLLASTAEADVAHVADQA
jgi:Polyketide cyclase / dehydrase and lipid transport